MNEFVIISGASGGSSVNAIRSLGKREIKVIAIDSRKDSPGFYSKYTSEAILHPDPSADFQGYVTFLKEICNRQDCLTILPMDEVTIFILSKYKREFSENIKTIFPDYAKLKMVQDSTILFKIAEELNIPIPYYIVPKSDLDARSLGRFPVVLKSRYSVTIKSNQALRGTVRYTSNIEETEKGIEEFKNEFGHYPIIQEYIPGEGYAFFALHNEGKIRAKFQHHRLREVKYTGGPSSYRESVRIPELEAEGLKILDEIKWHGPAMVEFRRDRRDGKFKLLEINPRFWGSLNLALLSGVDFPYLFYQIAKEGDCEQVFDYKVGVKSKCITGELIHLVSIIKKDPSIPIDRPSIVKTFLSILWASLHVKDDFFLVRDIRPFICEIVSRAKDLPRYLTKGS